MRQRVALTPSYCNRLGVGNRWITWSRSLVVRGFALQFLCGTNRHERSSCIQLQCMVFALHSWYIIFTWCACCIHCYLIICQKNYLQFPLHAHKIPQQHWTGVCCWESMILKRCWRYMHVYSQYTMMVGGGLQSYWPWRISQTWWMTPNDGYSISITNSYPGFERQSMGFNGCWIILMD